MNNRVFEKTKGFISEHRSELIIAGISVVVIAGITICTACKISEMNKIMNAQKQCIRSLDKVCRAKDVRIEELVNLCGRKDAVFQEMISDGLRHGSSLAGRHMRERGTIVHVS